MLKVAKNSVEEFHKK